MVKYGELDGGNFKRDLSGECYGTKRVDACDHCLDPSLGHCGMDCASTGGRDSGLDDCPCRAIKEWLSHRRVVLPEADIFNGFIVLLDSGAICQG